MAKTTSAKNGLSARGWGNVEEIMPKIRDAVKERVVQDNPAIDLASAESWLIRDELIELTTAALTENLKPLHLSYPRAFAGYPETLAAFAAFFNEHFKPHLRVDSSHLATAPGAASCLDTFLYNVCDPGDGVLMPAPYWSGFDFQFKARSSAVPIAVTVSPVSDVVTSALVPALEDAFRDTTVPIKALLMVNPHNPLGLCYPRNVIEECMQFCQRHGIHYISDEVYALTSFDAPDLPDPVPFTSVLAIDPTAIGVEGSRVHAFWSTSKDFGQSGFRMGCSISQYNQEMAVGLALASNTQTSSLSAVVVASLLTSSRLPDLVALNSERLAENYRSLTAVLRRHSIDYISCNAGLYLFARIVGKKPISTISWEDEAAAVSTIRSADVLVSAGRGYHGHEIERGWARIGFGVTASTMNLACERLDKAFTELASQKP